MKHRFIIFIALFVLEVCPLHSTSAADVSVKVADMSGAPETSVTVPISANGGPKLAAARVVLTYDATMLEVEDVGKGQALLDAEAQTGYTVNEPGRVTMNFVSMDGVTPDRDLFLVNFKVKESTLSSSQLSIEKVLAWRADNQVDVLTESQNGTFTIESSLPLPPSQLLAIAAGVAILLIVLVLPRRRRSAAPVSAGTGVNCPKCGNANPADAKFCAECGTTLAGGK